MIDIESLPDVSAIYRVWHRDQVVYVGKTTNLKQRWKSHHIYPKLLNSYGTEWKLDWVEIPPDQLSRAEAFAYRHFKPVLNKTNPSALLGNPGLSADAKQNSSDPSARAASVHNISLYTN